MNKKPALGKGLNSLLPQRPPQQDSLPLPVTELEVEMIRPNPHQPRREFRDQQLEELASSIRADGVIQPLVIRRVEDGYELVAGERRLRAAKLAGLEKVPVVVREIQDDRLLEVALIENIQREDLNPIELASAFERMSSEVGLNHEEIGFRTGKDRATITNTIRLLQLPEKLQQLLADRKLSPGHARALLKLPSEKEQSELADQAIRDGWTVRQMEEYTQQVPGAARKKRAGSSEPNPPLDPNVRAAIQEMERALGTRVRIFDGGKGKGTIEIEFYSPEDLDRLYTLISQS